MEPLQNPPLHEPPLACARTIEHILGDHTSTSTDILLSTLRPRVLKSLLQLSSLCSCLPKELLLSGPPSKTARAKLLAEESLSDGVSLEKTVPWPCQLPTETCAQFHGCCDIHGNDSAGLAIFLESGLQPSEIYHCRVSLGSQCTQQTASYQACAFLLHALLSLSSLLSAA